MTVVDRDLLNCEEAKRNQMWDPAQRWRVLQETIAWAEKQLSAPRNTPAARLAEQSRKLEVFRRSFGDIFDGASEQ